MNRSRTSALLLAIGSFALMGSQDWGCITGPEPDTLVTGDTTRISGDFKEYDDVGHGTLVPGQVRLTLNGGDLPWITSKRGYWVYPRVSLRIGVNRISGATSREKDGQTITGTIDEVLIERRVLPSRTTQRVFLDWSAGGLNLTWRLEDIARHTLNGTLSENKLATFVSGVKDEVAAFFDRSFAGTNVVRVANSGTKTYRVAFVHYGDYLYGQAPMDYKNTDKTGTAYVYIGAFKNIIVNDDRLLSESAAKKTDSLQTRIKDVGTYIGRTVVHEVSHSLGLTNEEKLHGCEGGHNCEAYDEANPTDRFDEGHYIMDAGPKSSIHARMGHRAEDSRAARPPVFNKYNQSYLKIIQHASLIAPSRPTAIAALGRPREAFCLDIPHGGDSIGSQLRHAAVVAIARLGKATSTSYSFARVHALKGKVPSRFSVVADAYTRRKKVAAGRTYLLFLNAGGKGKPYKAALGYFSFVDASSQEIPGLKALVIDFVRHDKNPTALKAALTRHLSSGSRFAQYSAGVGLRRRRLLTARDVGSVAALMSQGKVSDPRAKLRVIRLVARHRSTRHKGLLNRFARSATEKPRVRWAALRALHRLGDKAAVRSAVSLIAKSRSLWLKRRLRRLMSR